MIDWESQDSHVLINPCYSEKSKQLFQQILNHAGHWPGHIWLATSGSTVEKWVGLSKQALLNSAQAVNTHLESDSSDSWALALPDFHVGGLGIRARSHLSQAKVYEFKHINPTSKWDASLFYHFLVQTKASLTALVPSQLFDLIQLNFKGPPALRAVVIGGGHLPTELLDQSKQKGWNILPSYGSTECASQVATASLRSHLDLKILQHMEVSIRDNRLAFKSPALLSAYAYFENEKPVFIDPKVEGWFVSMDHGDVKNGYLSIHGRIDEMIKIGGENVDVARLEKLLQKIKIKNQISEVMTLLPLPHERLGHMLVLVIEGKPTKKIEQTILKEFHLLILPFERIREVKWVEEIPKSSLLKILKSKLKQLIQIQ